jgi:two-component system CheB/CheR fusion protein
MKKTKPPKPSASKDRTLQNTQKDFLVVGIGASAGGITALKEFFQYVSAESGMAYVVILHLSPEFESKLAEILQLTAQIPVEQVNNTTVKIKPDCVYVIPPNKSLSMIDGYLKTSPIKNHAERRAPVDFFFRTLAESRESRAVSVILSGTGADGSMGVKRVKEKGGVIFVQDPNEAEFSDMPRNTIATNLADAILPVAEIPDKITSYKDKFDNLRLSLDDLTREETDELALRDIFTNLRIRTGHDFSNYKRATVLRRIERRMNVRELFSLPQYVAFLRETPEETTALLKDLLISVTNFFRDPEAFEDLQRDIIPKILEGKTTKDSVRVWVAGCATGEEAYSLAMLFAEFTLDKFDAPKVQIFATDIDEAAIATARDGLYSNSDVADVSPARLRRFFIKEDEYYRVRRELREMILFAKHNLIKDPPFSHLDLATCRNLLIYLNRSAQSKVMDIFHFALNPGNYLFLGSSESIESGDLFVSVNKERHIYQSRAIAARIHIPFLETWSLRFDQSPVIKSRTEENELLERFSSSALHLSLLEYYAPPSIVVNEEYDIVHMSESATRFTQMAGGEPSINLLKVVRSELRLELRTALYQAVQTQISVETPALNVKIDNSAETVNLVVRPVIYDESGARGFLLVIFKTSDKPETKESETSTEPISSAEPIARKLEEELVQTKVLLRSTIERYEVQTEELRASNEELQAMNEETHSAAEELETSKEELHSINEELKTVNQELKIKIEELSLSNNDFKNLMNSTDIGTIFLDRSLRIKMFTPNTQSIFNLIPNDLGRLLTDITGKVNYENLILDIESVLEHLQPIVREMQTNDGHWYLTRITPYRTADDHINGVILTFVDITERIKTEKDLHDYHEQVNEILESINDAFYAVDADFKFTYINRKGEEWLGRNRESLIGKSLSAEFPAAIGTELYNMQIKGLTERKMLRFETRSIVLQRWIDVSLYPSKSGGLSCYFRDISERKRTEDNLRESEERIRLLIESATDFAIFTITPDNLVNSWNTGAERVFCYKEDEIIGKSAAILFTPKDRKNNVPEKEIITARETGHAEDERWHLRKDGSRFFASGVMMPLKDSKGFLKIARDMTERIKAEQFQRDKEMLQKLVTAQEDERKRIARDLHDQLGQQMTALRLKIEATRKLCDDDEEICGKIDEIQTIAKHIDADVDFLAWELRPAALDDLGLSVSLKRYVQEWSLHSGVMSDFHSSGIEQIRLISEAETNLYRIAQEAFNNIWKHAGATNASAILEKQENSVVLIIEDNGRGFDVENKNNRNKGIGLIGMQERAALIGGTLEIESAPGQGTTIFVRVPIRSNGGETENE